MQRNKEKCAKMKEPKMVLSKCKQVLGFQSLKKDEPLHIHG